jgi:hypothetical protein
LNASAIDAQLIAKALQFNRDSMVLQVRNYNETTISTKMVAGRSPQILKTKVLRDKRFSEEKISMKGTSVEQIYLHSAVNEAAMTS